MLKYLLGVASGCVIGPLIAAVFEPVLFGAATGVGWNAKDVEKASAQMTSYIFGEYLPYSVGLMAFGMGVWAHWGLQKFIGKKGPDSISVEDLNNGYNLIPITGDLAALDMDLPSIEIQMRKHDAPNQDGIERNWKRVCFGFQWENVSPFTLRAKMRVTAFDPNGWRFVDEIFFDDKLSPEEWRDHFPVELHMRMTNTPRLRYDRDGVMTELQDDERLIVMVETYSDDVEIKPFGYAIRLPQSAHERFITDEAVQVPEEIEFQELS